MPELNPYGAPTQGLGQTITFAQGGWQTPNISVPQYGDNAYSVNFAQTGALGQTSVTNLGTPEADALWGLVSKVGGELTQRQIEHARQDRFFKGMQMAQAGKTAAEIAESQPFFARLFGADVDVVSGATAYNKAASVAEVISSFDKAPEVLQDMDAATFRGMLSNGLNGALSGDPVADGVVMGEYARHVPGLTARWTRARVAKQQKDAADAFGKNLGGAADVFSGALSSNLTNGAPPEDNNTLTANYLSSFTKPDGMALEAWQTQLADHASLLAEKGQFHALSAINGLLKELPAKAQARLLQVAQSNALQLAASPDAEQYHAAWASIKVQAREGKVLPAQVMAVAQNINDRWFQKTGSPVPFVGDRLKIDVAGDTQHIINVRNETEQRRAAALADAKDLERFKAQLAAATKAGEEDQKRIRAATIDSLILGHQPHLVATTQFTAEERESAVFRFARVLTSPTFDETGKQHLVALGHLMGVQGAGNGTIKGILGAQASVAMAGGPTSPAFRQAFDTFKRVQAHAPGLLAAYPTDVLNRLTTFAAAAPTGIPTSLDGKVDQNAVAVWQRVFSDQTGPMRMAEPSAKEATVAVAAMRKHLESFFPEAMSSSIDVQSAQYAAAERELKKLVTTMKAGGVPVTGETMAAYWTKAGGRAVGGFLWKDDMNSTKSVAELFRAGDNTLVFGSEDFNVGAKFREFVDKKRAAANADADLKDVTIMPDMYGTGIFVHVPSRLPGEMGAVIPVAYHDIGKFMHEERGFTEWSSKKATTARIDAWRKQHPGQISPDAMNRASLFPPSLEAQRARYERELKAPKE